MSAPLAILWFVAVLMFLVFIHELGHFVTAKWRGVKVLEFGIGMPPRIWGKQYGETLYSLNWIPIGGFCKMLGEEDPTESGSLASKSAGARLLVLSAGSLVMLLFPLIIFPTIYMVPRDIIVDFGEPVKIGAVSEESPAHFAGLQAGDQFVTIDETDVTTFGELKRITDEKAGTEVTVVVLRDSQEHEFNMVPRPREEWPADEGALGVTLDIDAATHITERESNSPWTAFRLGAELTWDTIVTMKDGLVAAYRHEIPLELGGVVAAGDVTTEIAETGEWRDLVFWAGLLSFNLGLVNLLPIPALDGGRIVFVLIEIARRGKRVSPVTEGKIHLVGFALLIALIVFVTYQDIARIVRGDSLLS